MWLGLEVLATDAGAPTTRMASSSSSPSTRTPNGAVGSLHENAAGSSRVGGEWLYVDGDVSA